MYSFTIEKMLLPEEIVEGHFSAVYEQWNSKGRINFHFGTLVLTNIRFIFLDELNTFKDAHYIAEIDKVSLGIIVRFIEQDEYVRIGKVPLSVVNYFEQHAECDFKIKH